MTNTDICYYVVRVHPTKNVSAKCFDFYFRPLEGAENQDPIPLSIGVNNVFEVGCEIQAKSIGDHNVFEPKCKYWHYY